LKNLQAANAALRVAHQKEKELTIAAVLHRFLHIVHNFPRNHIMTITKIRCPSSMPGRCPPTPTGHIIRKK
jgi:hypothetical protein